MDCDFSSVFDALGGALTAVAHKPGVYDTVFNSFTSQLLDSYPDKKDEIIAAAKGVNADYVEAKGGKKGKRRLTRRRKSKK